MNPMKLLQIKPMFDKFNQTHPRIKPFMQAVAANGLEVGTIMEVSVTTPDGRNFTTNLKVTESDLELVQALKDMN